MNIIYDFFRYFFHPIPGPKFNYYIPLLIIAAVLIIGGIAMKLYIRKHSSDNKSFRKMFGRVPYQLFWLAFFFLIGLFGRYEKFPLLGARFVLYVTALMAIYLIGKNVYSYVKVYPQQRIQLKETPAQKKYTTEKYSRR